MGGRIERIQSTVEDKTSLREEDRGAERRASIEEDGDLTLTDLLYHV